MTSLAEINQQIEKHDAEITALRKKAEELRNAQRSSVIEEVRQKIAEYGLTATELKLTVRGGGMRGAAAAAPKAVAAVKYRSPTGETWSGGRGRKPRWVVEALAAGKSLEEFEVQ